MLSVPALLAVAESVDGDPQTDDLGPLFAAVARHQAAAMGREVYGSLGLRAAALLETLARLPALEHSNRLFAWKSAVALCAINGQVLSADPKEAALFVGQVADGTLGIRAASRQIRTWLTA